MARQTSLPGNRSLPASGTLSAASQLATRSAGDRVRLALVLMIALCQGIMYLLVLPPWQHYDEPTHFEYAWLIANRTSSPQIEDIDQTMRRDVAASMLEHQFFWGLPKPDLLGDSRIEIGVIELGHPPAYYMLVSLPLRLVSHLDVTSQLYIARSVSLALFLITIAVATGLMRDLTPNGHPLRWAVPLALALIPPFVDLMTGVNSDAGAVAVFSLFLWGAVRTIRFGPTWPRLAWVFGTALLAAATKNTAALALLLAPLACMIAFWVRRGWRWRWLGLVSLACCVGLVAAVLGWGDAAYWYHGADEVSQLVDSRATSAAAPVGSHALLLEAPAEGIRQLISPLSNEEATRVAGHKVTIGGWLWADRPGVSVQAGLAYKTAGMIQAQPIVRGIALDTKPVFVSWTFEVPKKTYLLQYLLVIGPHSGMEPAPRVFLDGALIAAGEYPADQAPTFGDATATSGVWAGQPFTNLMLNGSAEAAWPRIRPWADRALVKYIHRSPAQSVASLLDVQRISDVFLPYMVQPALDTFVQSFAWSNVQLESPIWLLLARLLAVLALAGCIWWMVARRQENLLSLRPVLFFLALVGLLAWANTIFRPLPLLGEMYIVPAARYTFPAIIVTTLVLVAGWWALWPRRLQLAAIAGLIVGLLALNGAAISTIVAYYRAIPLS